MNVIYICYAQVIAPLLTALNDCLHSKIAIKLPGFQPGGSPEQFEGVLIVFGTLMGCRDRSVYQVREDAADYETLLITSEACIDSDSETVVYASYGEAARSFPGHSQSNRESHLQRHSVDISNRLFDILAPIAGVCSGDIDDSDDYVLGSGCEVCVRVADLCYRLPLTCHTQLHQPSTRTPTVCRYDVFSCCFRCCKVSH